MVRRVGSDTRLPKFLSQSCCLLAVLSWANYSSCALISLYIKEAKTATDLIGLFVRIK